MRFGAFACVCVCLCLLVCVGVCFRFLKVYVFSCVFFVFLISYFARIFSFFALTHLLTGSPSAFELYIYYNLYFHLRVLYSRAHTSNYVIRCSLQFDDLYMRIHHYLTYEI